MKPLRLAQPMGSDVIVSTAISQRIRQSGVCIQQRDWKYGRVDFHVYTTTAVHMN